MIDRNLPSKTALKDDLVKNREEWMRTAYLEAWRQYSHEDMLSVQRNNVFIVIQTAMLAALATAISGITVASPVKVLGHSISLNCLVLGVLFIAFGKFSQPLLNAWKSATENAYSFAELRRLCAMRIEQEVNLPSVRLATKEQEYKDAMAMGGDFYCPFPNTKQMDSSHIAINQTMGHASIIDFIESLKRLWQIIAWLGVGFIVLSIVENVASLFQSI